MLLNVVGLDTYVLEDAGAEPPSTFCPFLTCSSLRVMSTQGMILLDYMMDLYASCPFKRSG